MSRKKSIAQWHPHEEEMLDENMAVLDTHSSSPPATSFSIVQALNIIFRITIGLIAQSVAIYLGIAIEIQRVLRNFCPV